MNEISKTEKRIAWRFWSKAKPIFYVAQIPSGGSDWGYTDKIHGTSGRHLPTEDYAIALSPYWQRRFAADCRKVGAVARFQTPSLPKGIN